MWTPNHEQSDCTSCFSAAKMASFQISVLRYHKIVSRRLELMTCRNVKHSTFHNKAIFVQHSGSYDFCSAVWTWTVELLPVSHFLKDTTRGVWCCWLEQEVLILFAARGHFNWGKKKKYSSTFHSKKKHENQVVVICMSTCFSSDWGWKCKLYISWPVEFTKYRNYNIMVGFDLSHLFKITNPLALLPGPHFENHARRFSQDAGPHTWRWDSNYFRVMISAITQKYAKRSHFLPNKTKHELIDVGT